MNIPDVNPETIADEAMRTLVIQLLNVIEAQATEIAALRVEVQRLRDELARLKGGSGKPDIKPSVKPPSQDYSSEAERRTRTPRGKPKKNETLTVTREEHCTIDPETLPPDAERKDTVTTIVQHLRIEVEVIRFIREVWYSKRQQKTFTAPLPPGYHGGFSPAVHTFVLNLGHGANVSQPALLSCLRAMGLQIGTGTVARTLRDQDGRWAKEAEAIHRAGLASGPWVASDQTSTRVDGKNEVCHVVGNHLFTSYHTRPGGTRQDVLAVLWGEAPRFRLNDEAQTWLDESSLPLPLRKRLSAALPWDTELHEADLRQCLNDHGITLGRQHQQTVWDALAVAAYHAQTEVPVVPILLSDDAAAYDRVTTTHALCWVHEWRLYTKLHPQIPHHHGLLEQFRTDYWALYRQLLAYRTAPSAEARARLHDAFDTLIGEDTGYDALDDRMAMTADKRAELLAVLDHPELPLHNNDMELGARRRVRKRDVSFGPQSRAGARAWDTFQTIMATATKLGVNVFHYLQDRLVSPETTPSLAERIAERAGMAAQPAG